MSDNGFHKFPPVGIPDQGPMQVQWDPRKPYEVAEQELSAYLDSLHVTLWLDWDIKRPERKLDAIKYICDMLVALGYVQPRRSSSAPKPF